MAASGINRWMATRSTRSLRRLAVAGAAILLGAGPAHAEDVALTFDDVPLFGRWTSTADAARTTSLLLAGLVRHHFPATGFVNEIQLDASDRKARTALLSQWIAAGMDLGNHSYSHLSLTGTPVQAYIADVAKGETVTRALLVQKGRTPRWYRHPYLETGPTREIRDRFEAWLASHGYRTAPVTMENSDWMFAPAYDDAITRGDAKEARRIQQAYLNFTAQIVPWYRQAALDILGRRPAFVFLLHASRLNAASIDGLAAILKAQDLHAVSLDRAMADPAYRIADGYTGPEGEGWLERWSRTLHKDMPWGTLPKAPADIAAASARVAATPLKPPGPGRR